MSSPVGAEARKAATEDWGGLRVRSWVEATFPTSASVLDVGAGWGKYRNLLPGYPNMDACEVWFPYIEAERLDLLYRQCFLINVVDLIAARRLGPAFGQLPMNVRDYDLVILGDVLEHLSRHDARAVLAECRNAAVVVPFRYHQDEVDGNPHERHVQDDLTPELMAKLYPDLEQVDLEMRGKRAFKGFYVKEER